MNDITLQQAISARRTCRDFTSRPVSDSAVRRLLWAAQGVTGRGGKRTAPSAHALYPLRLFLTAGNIEGRETGVYELAQDTEELALRKDDDVRQALQEATLEDQPWVGRSAGVITVCADFAAAAEAFAEQPPLGERGARYVYVEAGAAAQNVQLQAVAEGVGCVLVAGFRDAAVANILGLESGIDPVLHLCFGWPSAG